MATWLGWAAARKCARRAALCWPPRVPPCRVGRQASAARIPLAPSLCLPACLPACLQVEPGWQCTKTSPSVCTQGGGGGQPADPHSQPDAPGGGDVPPAPPGPPPPPASGSKHSSGHGWATTIVVLAVVAAVVAALVASRERIYDHFPEVSRAARDGAGGGGVGRPDRDCAAPILQRPRYPPPRFHKGVRMRCGAGGARCARCGLPPPRPPTPVRLCRCGASLVWLQSAPLPGSPHLSPAARPCTSNGLVPGDRRLRRRGPSL